MFSQQEKINIKVQVDQSVEPTNKERRNGGRIGGLLACASVNLSYIYVEVF